MLATIRMEVRDEQGDGMLTVVDVPLKEGLSIQEAGEIAIGAAKGAITNEAALADIPQPQ